MQPEKHTETPGQDSQAAPRGNGKQEDYKRLLLACMYPHPHICAVLCRRAVNKLEVQTACCGKCAVIFYAGTMREWPEIRMGMALDPAQTGKAAGYGNEKPVE